MDLRALVEAARAGESEAFGQLVDRFQDMAYGYAYALLGDFHLAQDAAQDAFIEAYRSLGELRAAEAFPGWLRRIVAGRCGRIKGARQREAGWHAGAVLDITPAKTPAPDANAERAELRRQVEDALRTLSEPQREATALYYINGYDTGEIANFLELPVTTVKKRLHDARQLLKERMLQLVENGLPNQAPSQNDRLRDAVAFMRDVDRGETERVRAALAKQPALAKLRAAWTHGASTPLHVAAHRGSLELCRLLLDAGADVMARDEGDNATPLHWAAEYASPEVAALLLDRGADPNATDDLHEGGPLGWALSIHGIRKEMGRFLIERGARPNVFALLALCEHEAVRAMVKKDPAQMAAKQSAFESRALPLHFAARNDLDKAIELLLELGADALAKDDHGRTAIDLAAVKGNAKAFDALKARGIVPDAELLGRVGTLERARKRDAVHRAALEGHTQSVMEMIARDPWVVNEKHPDEWGGGTVPLHAAAMGNHLGVMRALIDAGADLEIRDDTYDSPPFGWAKEFGKDEAMELLLESGCKASLRMLAGGGKIPWMAKVLAADAEALNRADFAGTPLHDAARFGRIEAIRWLLDRGADPQRTDPNGQTPLQLVERMLAEFVRPGPKPEHPAILDLLKEASK